MMVIWVCFNFLINIQSLLAVMVLYVFRVDGVDDVPYRIMTNINLTFKYLWEFLEFCCDCHEFSKFNVSTRYNCTKIVITNLCSANNDDLSNCVLIYSFTYTYTF